MRRLILIIIVNTYDTLTNKMTLNGKTIRTSHTSLKNLVSTDRTSFWEDLGSDSHYISWAEGTTVAVVAAVIAVPLSTLGAKGVIAAMGVGALGVIAANSSGGTIYIHLYTHRTLTNTLNRTVWSFTAGTGDSYGPYEYIETT